jgi:hypothetical protein
MDSLILIHFCLPAHCLFIGKSPHQKDNVMEDVSRVLNKVMIT